MKKEKLQYNGALWMALNVKDIEVMEEKTNVLDHILLFILVYTLVLHVISSN